MFYIFENICIDGFCFLIYSPLKITKEYIFDFNPTNSLIIFPWTLSFILTVTFLLTGSKSFFY